MFKTTIRSMTQGEQEVEVTPLPFFEDGRQVNVKFGNDRPACIVSWGWLNENAADGNTEDR